MRRRPARLLIALGLPLATLLVALAWLLATESGLQFLWRALSAAAGPGLAVTQPSGSLAGGMQIRALSWETADFRLDVEALAIDWEPRALLAGTLHLRKLAAAAVRYAGKGQAAPGPLELPEVTLPLRLRLDALQIGSLGIAGEADGTALEVRDIALAGSAARSRIILERVALSAPGLALDGSAELALRGDYPLQGTLNWQWQAEGLAPLAATTRLAGSLRRLELTQTVQPPWKASAALVLSDVLETPRVEGKLSLNETDLAAIDAGWPALYLNAALELSGAVDDLGISGTGNGRDAGGNRVDAALEARLLGERLELRMLRLAVPDQPAQVQAEGHVDFAGPQPGFALTLAWQQLDWPLFAEPQLRSAAGNLALEGTPGDYRFSAEGRLDAPAFTPASVRLQGHGDTTALQIGTLQSELLDGSLQGSARLAWSPRLSAGLQLDGKHLNPARRWADWPGDLALRLQAELDAGAEPWQLRFQQATLSGRLRGRTLSLAASGGYRPGELHLERGTLSAGASHVRAQGRAGAALDLDWRIDSPDLADLLPGAAGRLSGDGRLQGTAQAPRLSARLAGHGLLYGEEAIRELQLAADIDAGGVRRSDLQLTLAGARLAGTRLETIALTGSGTPQAHELQLVADGEQLAVAAVLAGGWQAPTWTYTLRSAELTPAGQPTWRLQQAVTGRVSAARALLPEACWRAAGASLCLQAETDQTATSAAFRLQSLPLATLAGLLPAGAELQGELDGSGSYRQPAGGNTTAALELSITAGELRVTDAPGEAGALLAFAPGRLRLEQADGRARLAFTLPLQGGPGGFTGEATLSAGERGWLHGPLQGTLQADFPDIAFAGELLPEVSQLSGRLNAQMSLAGTAAAPRLRGNLLLADGRAMLDTPGLVLEDIRVALDGRPDGSVDLDAQTRSGDGVLQITGRADLAGATTGLRLAISGTDVRVVNTLDARIDASPQLQLSLDGNRVDLDGEIVIPRASIHPSKLPESAVTASGDQVIIENGAPRAKETDYPLHARVRFTLGDAVEFDGLGLTGRLGGSVLAVDAPGRPTRATGELNIREGRYRAYGQDLQIRRGRLLFAGGPLTQPGLDIEAVRRPVPDILTGVRVRGSLQQPKLTLFSEPPMPQSEQLSWLVLGRSLQENTSDEEQSALNRAALMLALGGGESLGKSIGERIGVDEVSIESETVAGKTPEEGDTTTASLMLGKYLTPKLFVSYGVGLFEPVSTLHLRYTLNSRWKLVGSTSGEHSSGDLFYVIERGK